MQLAVTVPDEAVLEITGIAAGGDGVARHDGMVVFVPRAAPGDAVRAELRRKKRFAQGRLRTIVRASPERVEPACMHYSRDRCGGCQLQHLSPRGQREAKRTIIRDAITRIGRRAVDAPEIRPSPAQWRYRNKLTLALRRQGAEWIAGLHPYDAPGEVFALRECPITDDRVLEVWRAILAASDGLPDAASLRGAVRVADGAASLVLEGGTAWPRSGDLFHAVDALGSVWWIPEGGVRTLLHARGEAPGSPAFAQVNPGMARALREHVLERIGALAPESVIYGYAGEGELAADLERRGMTVTTIESDPEAVPRTRTRLSSCARVIEGRVEDALERALPADLIVLNPPRTGLHERIPALLTRGEHVAEHGGNPAAHDPPPASHLPPPALLYISCDPATLARDLARLPDYRITSLVAFDMFPQTAHVETVCELRYEG
jgi:23S rRNA (uracil1939-C5)-methyltransferase